ncbi:Internalin-J precursor [Burkholderia pseudomallei]|uniref:hypothetical protein n=1 Tax=Burkholderia pseudomallei TaxID=28450 RepID=UPI0005DCA6BC|nr:hypothetical protein [Burkholderia pseudomallei]CAK1332462.1 Internalin-J precursor [Burkholderia pseudomallei]
MEKKLNTKEEIEQWLDKMEIKNYSINDDLTVDVDGSVDLFGRKLTDIPVQFNHVSMDFHCNNNQLASLRGAPQTVGKCFDCSENQLTSLEGCPQTVRGFFFCSNNQLTTLEGCPQIVGESFSCSNNQLITLEGCPQIVGDNFSCSNNQLTSLEGAPKIVGGGFYCLNNQLTSLEGVPQKLGGVFECRRNNVTLAEIAHFKISKGKNIRLSSFDYSSEEIDKAVKIIALHETVDKAVKQKDELPMARATSNVQVSATRTGKRKI